MKTYAYLTLVLGFTLFAGCKENLNEPDLTPPSPPQGLYTVTGDGTLELFWNQSPEPDVAGYDIYSSTSLNGKYQLIGSTKQTYFVDNGVTNGVTYYYAVSAYDFSGNESAPSRDIAYDTPRPEGYGVSLTNYRTAPGNAGYDFSTYSVVPYNDNSTDVYFEYYNGVYYLDVPSQDTDIQDMGYTTSLYEIVQSPTAGWSPTKDAQAIIGHTYVIWTWDNHYAKMRVTDLSSNHVTFDWAYQLQPGNVRLKTVPADGRASNVMGPGAASR